MPTIRAESKTCETIVRTLFRSSTKKLHNKCNHIKKPKIGTEGGAPPSAQIQEGIKRVIDNTYLVAFDHHVRVLDTSAYNGRQI